MFSNYVLPNWSGVFTSLLGCWLLCVIFLCAFEIYVPMYVLFFFPNLTLGLNLRSMHLCQRLGFDPKMHDFHKRVHKNSRCGICGSFKLNMVKNFNVLLVVYLWVCYWTKYTHKSIDLYIKQEWKNISFSSTLYIHPKIS